MRRWHLSKRVQSILVFFVFVLTFTYAIAFVYDFSKYYTIFNTNNKIVETNSKYIDTVKKYSETKNGKYKITVEGSDVEELSAKANTTLYTLYLEDDNWLYYNIKGRYQRLYTTGDSLVSKIKKVKDGYKVTVNNITFTVDGKNSPIYTCSIMETGDFQIFLANEQGNNFVEKSLDNVEKTVYKNNQYKLKFTSKFSSTSSSNEIMLVTNLKTNDIYFDSSTNTLLKNAGVDFLGTYILESKMLFVLVFNTLWVVVLYLVGHGKILTDFYLTDKGLKRVYTASILMPLSYLIPLGIFYLMLI